MNRKLGDVLVISTLGAMVTLAATPLPAGAAMIDTATVIEAESRRATVEQIQELLGRQEVRDQLQAFGVDPQAAERRVASMTAEEVAALQQRIAELPAGANGAIEVLGILFLVLLVLELIGVTNVFSGV